jgi:hypothetical protein
MAVPASTLRETTILNNNFIRVIVIFHQPFVYHQAMAETVSRNPWLTLWGIHPMENRVTRRAKRPPRLRDAAELVDR